MIRAQRAPVKPRVFSNDGNDALLLEDEIARLLESGERGLIAILGPAGSGKTTALQHLAAVLPADAFGRLVVYAARVERPESHLAIYRLAAWEKDDLIEYLLTNHRSRCAAVMARMQDNDHNLLGGITELWRIVLDRLAADDSIPDARRALHRHLEAHLCDTDLLERARSACLNAVVSADKDLTQALTGWARPGFVESLIRVLRHAPVQLMLAAERIAAELHGDGDCDCLATRLPRELVRSAAVLLADDPRALEHLHGLLAGPSWSHAMSASLLHAAGTDWVPNPEATALLAGAYLDGIRWPSVDLMWANLMKTDLSAADLTGANLACANAGSANLSLASLLGATLDEIMASEANWAHADLSGIRASGAWYNGACLDGANLDKAVLRRASFVNASLTGAAFRGADLSQAYFVPELNGPPSFCALGAVLESPTLSKRRLDGADFSGADLTEAVLWGLCLTEAVWTEARFTRADMRACNLEGLILPGADFTGANLGGSLLTDACMPGACFKDADLHKSGLANVDWEGADLRGANLRGATFHMGSSRSGLVGSPIACEGSKTGFYTDDYDEQTYKAPEEIRKANLCGADLRGARIDGVDFYLVDLRGALFDADQELHLRRCGAILGTRV